MFAVRLSLKKKHAPRFRWSMAIGVALVTWLAVFAANKVHDSMYLSDSRAAAGEVTEVSAPYFSALKHLYGISVEQHSPESNQSMPPDEFSKFHELETHLPIQLARITSEFGERPNPFGKGHVFHRGIDLAAPLGTPVYAVAEGTVIRATTERTYGKVVVINHHNGYMTLYAHNSQLLVKAGERIEVGQQIAKVGSTGRSTGPHLHFEIHRDGERIDPSPYLAALSVAPSAVPQNNKAAQG